MAGIVTGWEALDHTSRLPLLPFDARPAAPACQRLDRLAAAPAATGAPASWRGSLRRSVMAGRVLAAARFGPPPPRESPPPDLVPTAESVAAYRTTMDYVRSCVLGAPRAWDTRLVLRVHSLVVAGTAASQTFRLPAGDITPRPSTLYVGAPAVEVPGLVELLSRIMAGRFPHPAVAAAWVHVATVAIHPFDDGNGRLGRVLASLAMYQGGFEDPADVSLEEWWGEHNDEYHAMTSCIRPAFNRSSDVTSFVVAHVEAQLDHAEAARTARRRP